MGLCDLLFDHGHGLAGVEVLRARLGAVLRVRVRVRGEGWIRVGVAIRERKCNHGAVLRGVLALGVGLRQ